MSYARFTAHHAHVASASPVTSGGVIEGKLTFAQGDVRVPTDSSRRVLTASCPDGGIVDGYQSGSRFVCADGESEPGASHQDNLRKSFPTACNYYSPVPADCQE